MVGPLVCGTVSTIATAILLRSLKIESLGDGLAFGTLVGFGYLAATTVNTGINPNIPRPLLYGLRQYRSWSAADPSEGDSQ
jgi:hypothetical protein